MANNCFVCERIDLINKGKNPYFVKELESGYVVLGDYQFYKGYTIFISKIHTNELHKLGNQLRSKFLNEMAFVAEAVYKTFKPRKLNYELLGNTDSHLHWHIFPRYKNALKNLKPDCVVTNEADFGFNFKHMPMMLEKIDEGYDVVVASRHVGDGRTDGWNFDRRVNHFIANTFFAKTIAGVNEVYDKNGAFRAIRVKGVLDKIKWSELPTRGFGFFFYMIYKLSEVTDKFYEFPAVFTFRTKGESKVSFNPRYIKTYVKDILEYVSLAFKIRIDRIIK